MFGINPEEVVKGSKYFTFEPGSKMALIFNVESCDCGEEIQTANAIKVSKGSKSKTAIWLRFLGLTERDLPFSEGYYDEWTNGTCCDSCKPYPKGLSGKTPLSRSKEFAHCGLSKKTIGFEHMFEKR